MRPMLSISLTMTVISSPMLTTSSTDSTRSVESSPYVHQPSLPGRISTNAPKFMRRTTLPV